MFSWKYIIINNIACKVKYNKTMDKCLFKACALKWNVETIQNRHETWYAALFVPVPSRCDVPRFNEFV